jgi:hypothetical protein
VSEPAALIPVDSDEELPEQVWKLRQEGLSNAQIGRRLLISPADVASALDRVLPALDARYRRQSVSEALQHLDVIIGYHSSRMSDPDSTSLTIRALCEKRFWIGLTGSTDPVQFVQSLKHIEGETSMSPFKRGIDWLAKWELLARDGRAEEPLEDLKPGKAEDPNSADDPTSE